MATAGLPLWSTTAANNGNADPAVNWAEGMAPSAVNDSARAEMASVAKWRDDLYGITAGLSTGGTSTAFTVTTNSTYATAAAMSGAMFSIIPHATNGASPTLAVDGLTARAINSSTGVAVGVGSLINGTPYLLRYVHASTEFIVVGITADIIGITANTALATDDTLLTYDLSATANRRVLISDFFKIINAFSADATPDTAADYVMTYDASASAAKKVLLSNLPGSLPRTYQSGCTLSNGTDATNDINISPGKWRDSTDAVDIIVSTALGKQLDANWAAGGTTGSPAGMRNSAASIANATYHLYLGRTAASSAGDIYAYAGVAGTDPDSSASIATMLTAWQAETGGASYVYARRIGSIIRASAAILPFVQKADQFILTTPVNNVAGDTNPGISAVTRTVTAPLGVVVEAMLSVSIIGTTSAGTIQVYLSSLDSADVVPGYNEGTQLNSGGASPYAASAAVRVWTNTSAQIRSRLSVSAGSDSFRLTTFGWRDLRGRDA